jgi:hypothetical protein
MAKELKGLILIGICLTGWIAFADHPTARNLRAALIGTLPFA